MTQRQVYFAWWRWLGVSIGLGVAMAWSLYPSFAVIAAVVSFRSEVMISLDESSEASMLEVSRAIQKHFLNFGVYVPLEDIFLPNQIARDRPEFVKRLRSDCGDGSIAVWVPMKVKMPIIGERAWEWCWTPMSKK